MSAPSAVPIYTQGFGTSSTNPTIISQVAPGNFLPVGIKLGQHWINEAANTVYILTSVSTSAGVTTPTWTLLESGASAFLSLTGDTGTATPSSGNVKIAGTANQITTAASGSTITLSIPSSPSLPGTVTSGTGFTATTGNLTLSGAASKVLINATTASTASAGFVTLSGSATTTLTSSAITANSIILFSLKTLGTLSASAITYTTTGGSATITPAGSTDTSTYGYVIIN